MAATVVASCSIPTTFYWYEPQASWAQESYRFGCPIHTPAVALVQRDFPNLSIHFSILDDINARNQDLTDPMLVIDLGKRAGLIELLTQSYEKRKAAEVHVKTTARTVRVELANGTIHIFDVPEFASDMWFRGARTGTTVKVQLKGIKPQSLTVYIPNFIINGEPLEAGPIRFEYKQTTRAVC